MHAVLERHLDVDEMHLKDGKEPNLYPKNWNLQKDYFGKKVLFALDKSEQTMVQRAVEEGISKGVIVRQPNAVVEYEEKIILNDEMHFVVKIDYAYDWTIEDHKSCNNFRYTLVEDPKHKRYIGNDPQLKVYAYHWCIHRRDTLGLEIPEYVELVHNQFCLSAAQDTPEVRKVRTMVKFSECEKEWLDRKAQALEQLEVRKAYKAGKVNEHKMEKNLSACSAYGGCCYTAVCFGQEAPKFYKRKVDLAIEEITLQLEPQKEENVGFNLSNNGATSAQDAVLKEVANQNKPKEVKVSKRTFEVVSEELVAKQKPFKDTGLDISVINGFPGVKELVEELEEINKVEAKAKSDAKKEVARLKKIEAAAVKKKQEASDKRIAEATAAKALADAATEETIQIDEEPEQPATPDKGVKVGSKAPVMPTNEYTIKPNMRERRKDLVVLIDCAILGGNGTNMLSLNQLFGTKSQEVARHLGFDSYFNIEIAKRREVFYEYAESIREELAGYYLIVGPRTGDETALLSAIIQCPKVRVIQG
jgi:hypothetical protein